MARQGGSYVMRNGKAELVHRTKPGAAAEKPAAAPASESPQAPATPEKSQKTGKVKEADNG
ncbi:hypothetical protein [Vreelandella venusta]|uniref:hypothetical protein n=1 Tax=Vreelandella venusta TaxID=44935 RepID=UPI002285C653|nr:hypothetical protein [Halomonas venusta]WAM57372.1 hypothetical protein L0519_09260 [Halomonas venusta]